MTWQISLGSLNLMTGGFFVARMDTSTPGRVRLWLVIDGPTPKDILDNVRLVEAQLNLASRQSQPASGTPWVTLDVRAGANSTLVRFQVRRGRLVVPRDQVGGVPMSEGGFLPDVLVELECLEHTAGEPIELGPFEVSADNPTLFLERIPGDEPALVEMRIRDLSEGAVINRIRVGARSLDGMEEGDFNPVIPFVEDDNEEPDTFTGGIAGITASQTWQTISNITSAASAYVRGMFDWYVRLRDATENLGAPSGLSHVPFQGIIRRQIVGANISSESTVGVSFDLDTLPGSHLVMTVSNSSGSVFATSAATVSTPSGWTLAQTVAVTGSFGNVGGSRSTIFYITDADTVAASTTIQVTLSAANNGRVTIMEYIGMADASPLDVSSTNTNSDSATASTGSTGSMSQDFGLGIALVTTQRDGSVGVPIVTTGDWNAIGGATGSRVAERVIEAGGSHSVSFSVGSGGYSASLVVVFKAAATDAPAEGTFPAGERPVRVVALDAADRMSASSDQYLAFLPVIGSLTITWVASSGPVDHYRVYVLVGSTWRYFETPNAGTVYTITGTSYDGTEDPPDFSTIAPASYRMQLGLAGNSPPDLVTTPFYASIANDTWEPAEIMRSALPSAVVPLMVSAPDWTAAIQGKADTSTQLDIDALFLMPADEQQIDVQYTANNLTENREWVYGTTPDLRSYGFLRHLDTAAVTERVMPIGYCLLGPGDTTVVFLVTVAGGVWQIDDVALEVWLTIVPQYRWLAGGA